MKENKERSVTERIVTTTIVVLGGLAASAGIRECRHRDAANTAGAEIMRSPVENREQEESEVHPPKESVVSSPKRRVLLPGDFSEMAGEAERALQGTKFPKLPTDVPVWRDTTESESAEKEASGEVDHDPTSEKQ